MDWIIWVLFGWGCFAFTVILWAAVKKATTPTCVLPALPKDDPFAGAMHKFRATVERLPHLPLDEDEQESAYDEAKEKLREELRRIIHE